MLCRGVLLLALMTAVSSAAAIIDQIAIVVSNNSIIKDSDIDRDIRVTSFLNGQHVDLSNRSRKETANRLIDQIFIRKEIDLGDYPVATWEQASQQVDSLIFKKFPNEVALQQKLTQYGIVAPDLVSHFQWQLTVLRFIDARFKPAALVTDQEIEKYYNEHRSELQREHPGKSSLDNTREEINDTLIAGQVDKLFFAWLDDQRKQSKIRYFEESLR